jgi:hypothetical protein
MARAWRDALWGFENRYKDNLDPPNAGAGLWWYFAHYFPDELAGFLEEYGML